MLFWKTTSELSLIRLVLESIAIEKGDEINIHFDIWNSLIHYVKIIKDKSNIFNP